MRIGPGGGMRIRVGWRLWLAVLATAWALAVLVQVAGGAQAPPRTLLSSPVSAQSGHPVAGRVVREIDDPHSGNHWLLIDDPNSPGGPGRMILSSTVPADGVQSMPDGATAAGQPQAIRTQPMPVIHSGDRGSEEHTSELQSLRHLVCRLLFLNVIRLQHKPPLFPYTPSPHLLPGLAPPGRAPLGRSKQGHAR